MTDTASRTYDRSADDRVSIRAPEEQAVEDPVDVPKPGPMSVFVVLIAVAVGMAAALAFRTANPDTPLIILGGTLLCASTLALIGLYRYSWFLMGTFALRPALDDLIADEFGSFQPSAILGILVILVSALHLISRRFSGRWHRLTPLGWAMVVFFAGFLPSFVMSVDRGVSQSAMFGLASVTLLYLAVEQHIQDDRNNVWSLLAASAIGLVVPIVTGFVQFFWTGSLDPGGSGLVRIDGSFAHPNTFATYLVFAVLISAGVVPRLPIDKKLAMGIVASLASFLMIVTFARGAWASFLLGAMLMAARVNRKLVVVIAAGAVGAAAVIPGVGDRLANITATTGVGGGVKTDDSLGWRIGYWEKVWEFRTRNPVFGIGIDATKTQTVEFKDPHNSFLQAFIEGGAVGFVGFMGVLVFGVIAASRVWRKVKRKQLDDRMSLLAVGATAALFSVAAQLVTENVLLNTIVWWYMNIALALLAVITWPRRPSAADPDDAGSRWELPVGGSTETYAGTPTP